MGSNGLHEKPSKTNQKVPHHDCVIFLKINMADKTNPNTDLTAHYDKFCQE